MPCGEEGAGSAVITDQLVINRSMANDITASIQCAKNDDTEQSHHVQFYDSIWSERRQWPRINSFKTYNVTRHIRSYSQFKYALSYG